MDLEAISLCAHLTIILDDSEKCKKMLKIENRQDAQSVLNLIQTVRYPQHHATSDLVHLKAISAWNYH